MFRNLKFLFWIRVFCFFCFQVFSLVKPLNHEKNNDCNNVFEWFSICSYILASNRFFLSLISILILWRMNLVIKWGSLVLNFQVSKTFLNSGWLCFKKKRINKWSLSSSFNFLKIIGCLVIYQGTHVHFSFIEFFFTFMEKKNIQLKIQ